MSTITLRSVKGSGLTNAEIDANFTNLNTDKLEAAAITNERTAVATLTNKTLTAPTLTTQALNVTTNNYPNIRPSLDLDFANGQTVDPRITFARASTATRTNARGLIEAVASGVPRIDFDAVTGACRGLLIEEQRANLLTYSEVFDNAGWNKARATITANATTAPDGTLTADKLVEDTTSGAHSVYPGVITSTNTTYTASIYAKAAGRTCLSSELSNFGNGSAAVRFDLSNGTFRSLSNGGDFTATSASITDVGGGWYRCSLTATKGSFNSNTYFVVGADNGTTNVFTGDGTSGLFLWGAQLEAGAFPTSYQPSTETHTGRASTATFIGSNGLIQTASSGVARMNYNPLNLTVQPKLLLEASSANLLTYSEQFDNAAWTKTAATVVASSIAAPDGTLTADKLVETAVASDHSIRQPVTVTTATVYTVSAYLKAGERTQCALEIFTGASVYKAIFDLSSGAFLSAAGSGTYTITPVGSGWHRIAITATSTGTTLNHFIYPASSGVTNYTGDGTSGLFIWGAQLEAGAFPTSYIPTVASQVTRVADTSTSAQTTRAADVATMTGANFSSWYRQDEGSFVVDTLLARQAAIAGTRQYTVSDGASSSIGSFYRGGGTTGATVIVSGVTQVDLAPTGVIAANTAAKISLAYKANDFSSSGNGATVVTDTSGTVPTLDRIYLGTDLGTSLNGHLRSLGYYPKRLTNAELQALSTQ